MQNRALIFDIQDLSVQDGPGIRTTVFMKGCPLKCRWCANPEGQKPYPELMHISGLCNKTQKCVIACPYESVTIESENDFPKFNREICKDCETRECVEVCPTRAIKFAGKYLTLEELIKRIKPNLSFYKNSGGGVTFSGGEPFLQAEFIKEFLKETSAFGLSVGVETCGMFNWCEVRDIADKFDFIYFDLKCMDSDVHKNVTGSANATILSNLEHLAEKYSGKIIISVPVVPGVNDSADDIKDIAEFCKKNRIKNLRLLPYHSLGENKYYDLGREYFMNKNLSVSENQLEELKNVVESYGIECIVEF
jgi:pyruvate formate lyase activating enzyme